MNKSFYNTFVKELYELEKQGYTITEHQQNVIYKDCFEDNKSFFKQIPIDKQKLVANDLIHQLSIINQVIENENIRSFNTKDLIIAQKESDKQKKKDIIALEKLIKTFKPDNRKIEISLLANSNNIKDLEKLDKLNEDINNLLKLAKTILNDIKQNKIIYELPNKSYTIQNGEKLPKRTSLKNYLETLAKKYKIKNSTKLIKKLIKDFHPYNN